MLAHLLSASAQFYVKPKSFDEEVVSTAETARRIIKDYNKDGKINCIDRAIAFKIIWSANHIQTCEFVSNCNGNTFNHLFVRIKDGKNGWVYIEPNGSYRMEDVWGEYYNPAYNNCSNHNYWMKYTHIF